MFTMLYLNDSLLHLFNLESYKHRKKWF